MGENSSFLFANHNINSKWMLMKENLKEFFTFRQILSLFDLEKKTFFKNFTVDQFFL